MAVEYSPESAYAKELAKFEAFPTGPVTNPRKPWVFQMYPRMLYKAAHSPNGPVVISDNVVAQNESHEIRLRDIGWSLTQEAAIEAVHAEDTLIAELAANRAFTDRKMSPKAKAEAEAVDQATSAHLPVIPETPIKRRGRPITAKE